MEGTETKPRTEATNETGEIKPEQKEQKPEDKPKETPINEQK
jgi:hypothetical protein